MSSSDSPIRIYLDSSDYLRFYRGEFDDVYSFLLKCKNEGSIEIGFSFTVIFEVLQEYAPKYLEDRLARANCISELCGKNCFAWIGDLTTKSSFSKEGKWYPHSDLVFNPYESYKNMVDEKFSHLSRSERRKLKSKKQFQKFVIENPVDGLDSRIKQEFPVSDQFSVEDIFDDLLRGKTSARKAQDNLFSQTTDPVEFIRLYFEKYGNSPSIIAKMHELSRKLHEPIKKMIEFKDQFTESISDFDNQEKSIKQKMNELSKKNTEFDKILKDKYRHLLQEVKIEKRKRKQNLEFDNFMGKLEKNMQFTTFPPIIKEILTAYMGAALKGTFHAHKKSDAGDIMHAMYIPYTDIWRGDKAFSNILINNQISGFEKIVPTLNALPNVIEKILSQRS